MVESSIIVKNVDDGEVVALTTKKVVCIVGGRDFDSARAKFFVN